MSIIVSKDGKGARKIDRMTVPYEDYLQKYIYDNPEAMPLDDIKEEIRLLILAREFPTPSGPIDVLGVDQDGDIYVIETKLYKNPDKRLVVAQVLDYGAALWGNDQSSTEFLDSLEKHMIERMDLRLHKRIEEFFGFTGEDLSQLLDRMSANVLQGKFNFVVLMDQLSDRLKHLIAFINQNSKFTLYGCELEFYKHDDFEILIPNLYGAEIRKNLSNAVPSERRRWDETTYFEDLGRHLNTEYLEMVRRLYDFFRSTASSIVWGTGVKSGSFTARYSYKDKPIGSVVSVYSNGTLQLPLSLQVNDEAQREFHQRFREGLRNFMGLNFPESVGWPMVKPEDWLGKVDVLIKILTEILLSKSHSSDQ